MKFHLITSGLKWRLLAKSSLQNRNKHKMEGREVKLGFKPQKELKYNSFLPYSEYLDDESNHQLAEIKANLGLSIQNRDIKTAATHWTGQLAKCVIYYMI